MNNPAHKTEPEHFASELTTDETHKRAKHEAAIRYSVTVPSVDAGALERALEAALPKALTSKTTPAPKRERVGCLFVSGASFYTASRYTKDDSIRVTITFQDRSPVKDDGITLAGARSHVANALRLVTTVRPGCSEETIRRALDGIVQAAHDRAVAVADAREKAKHYAATAERIGDWMVGQAVERAAERVRFEERLAALVDEYKAAARTEAIERFARPPSFYDEEKTAPIEPEILALVDGFRGEYIAEAVSRAHAGRGFPRTHRPVIVSDDYHPEVTFLAAALLGDREDVDEALAELRDFGRPSDED
jgi:hypothetical protein